MARSDAASILRRENSVRGGKTKTSFPGCGLTLLLLLVGLVVLLVGVPAKAAQVSLAWDRNTETDIAGYRVYYGTASRVYNWFIDVGNTTAFTVTGLTDGATYYFAATAYDTSHLESTYSVEASKSTCTYSISPPSQSFVASAGTGTVSVSTQSTCPWTAASGVSWLTITSGSSGTGNGTVRYSVSANTSSTSRSVSSTIAKSVFTVTQAGTSGSTYTITASAGVGGTISPSGSVSVAQGGGKAFIIAANTGYQISSVMVDGVSQGAVSSYTFSNVTANHTISASFNIITNKIPASGASSLSVQMAQPPTSVSLSTEGTSDWAHWGLTTASSFNHKSGVTQQISNYTLIGSTTVGRMTDSRVAYSWSGGTPTASAANSKTGIYFTGIGNGYRLTVPAVSVDRTLKLYLGLWVARGRFEAKLSDGSVTPYVAYLDNSTTSVDRVVTLRFSSASSGVNLIIEYTVENNYGKGNITLQAATLVASLP
jgi:hypothetical protein